jgi:2-polyprenyl-3-methyl-5-hydroxy-6-metoxy-1,4-benzoquinol methylase
MKKQPNPPRVNPPDCYDLYWDGRHYDLQTKDFVEDISFYERQIDRYGQPVLELACGTGRITIPLAKKGIDITGLDVTESMLSLAREKARSTGLQIEWVLADCRDFHMRRKFRLVFIPVNSITHLHALEDLESCLHCIREHLEDQGRFIIDVFNPRLDILLRDPNKRYPVAEYEDPDGNGTVVITENNIYDTAAQINHIKWYYRIGDKEDARVVENNMRILYPQELDELLHYNGFEVEVKYGNYDQSPFKTSSPKQLTICGLNK